MTGRIMDEGKFWFSIWSLAAAVIGLLILAIMADGMYTASLVESAVKSGADPIKARCGIAGWSDRSATVCALAVKSGTL